HVFFALHTYYAQLLKLVASLAAARFPLPCRKFNSRETLGRLPFVRRQNPAGARIDLRCRWVQNRIHAKLGCNRSPDRSEARGYACACAGEWLGRKRLLVAGGRMASADG